MPRSDSDRVARTFASEGASRSITEEIALAALDPRLQALLDLTSDGILLRDRQGRVVFASAGAAQALGTGSVQALQNLGPDELAQLYTVESPDGRAQPLPAFPGTRLFRGGHEPDLVLRFSERDARGGPGGADRWVVVRTRPFAEENGRLITVLSLLRDITAERRREGQLRFLDEAQGRLARALSSTRVLEHAAVMAVPRLGDECVLALPDGQGSFAPAAWYMPGAAGEPRASTLVRGLAPLYPQVVTGGRALLVGASPGGAGAAPAGSVVLAPVKQANEVLALMVLPMLPETGRCHRPGDLALVEQLADRVGLALRNVGLLEAAENRLQEAQAAEARVRALALEWENWTTSFVGDMSTELPVLQSAAELMVHEVRDTVGPLRAAASVVARQAQRLRAMADAFNEGEE
jgi:hypothetical protein